MRNKNSKQKILMGAWLISVILIGLSTLVIGATTSYQLTLTRGSQTLLVSTYDKKAWESNVGKSETPKSWFGGDANDVKSQSRITIRSTNEVKYETYDLWTLIFMIQMSPEVLALLTFNASQFRFTQDQVNRKYSNTYSAWEILYSKWAFNSTIFGVTAENPNNYIWILQNPKDYKEILNNYNEWANNTNNKLQFLGLSVPTYTNEGFLWLLVLDGMIAASPVNDYLSGVINGLNVNDAEVNNNILTIDRSGNKDYKVDISYGSNGMAENYAIKTSNGDIIYEISQENTYEILTVIIPIIIIVAIVGIVIAAIKKRRNRE